MGTDELMEEYREIVEIMKVDYAYALASGSTFRRENAIVNALHDKDVDIEQCLSCELPVRAENVEENTCPECDGVFDIPEELADKPAVDDKETILDRQINSREFGWALPIGDEITDDMIELAKKTRQKELEQKLREEGYLPEKQEKVESAQLIFKSAEITEPFDRETFTSHYTLLKGSKDIFEHIVLLCSECDWSGNIRKSDSKRVDSGKFEGFQRLLCPSCNRGLTSPDQTLSKILLIGDQ